MKQALVLLCGTLISISCMGQKVDNSPVKDLSLQSYLGTWYEIAKMDHSFEKGVEYATADYTLMDDNTVRVVNSGIKDGKVKTSIGKAKLTGTPGLLRVSFFWPFYADYRVLMITDDYKHALVGSRSYDYLWILSRYQKVPQEVLEQILLEAQIRGYDTDRLIWVTQDVPDVLWDIMQ